VMIGPSSSHTAGACRIGRAARKILNDKPVSAYIHLSGSFAATYKGHGTDLALVGGLLDMRPDDERIRRSFAEAAEQGLEFAFEEKQIPRSHPNTVEIFLSGETGKQCVMQGASVGGGNILITMVNEMETSFTGSCDTLIIAHEDKPGMIAAVAAFLSGRGINIGNFRLNRPRKGFEAVMTLELDGSMDKSAAAELRSLPHISGVCLIRAPQSEAANA